MRKPVHRQDAKGAKGDGQLEFEEWPERTCHFWSEIPDSTGITVLPLGTAIVLGAFLKIPLESSVRLGRLGTFGRMNLTIPGGTIPSLVNLR